MTLLKRWGCEVNNSLMTDTVSQIGRMNITGNVIPANWWHHIKMPSGKPDTIGMVLLSEIISNCDQIKNNEGLQRSYQSFSEQFGFTKREVTEALKRLRNADIIIIELRIVDTQYGACHNVTFFKLNLEKLHKITY